MMRCRWAVVWTATLLLAVLEFQVDARYSRTVSYQNEIVLRCPDKNKATVQVLQQHADVWHQGKESVDMRLKKSTFARVQTYFPECYVIVEDLEAHVKAAEAQMFPARKTEQDAWLQTVVQALYPKSDLKDCEAKIEEWEGSMKFQEIWHKEFHTYDEIVGWYRELAARNSSYVTFTPSIGQTHEKRNMPCIKLASPKNPKTKRFYIQCQIHAREWISGATCMYLAQHLVDSYHVVPNVSHIMDNLEIVLVPFVNPDGYVHTWSKDRMWRKNRNSYENNEMCVGVDINRNFPTGFKHEDKPCAEDYGGPFAKSELETRHIMKNYRANAPILGSLDVHSYGQLLLRPWGHTNVTAPDDKYHADIGRKMVQLIKKVNGMQYTSETSHDLYPCYGIVTDWFYGADATRTNLGYRSASFCLELRDKGVGPGMFGFLLPPNQIIPTAREVIPGILHYMEKVLATPIRSHTSSSFTSDFEGHKS